VGKELTLAEHDADKAANDQTLLEGAIPEYGDAAETASMTGRAKELVWSSSRFFGLL
jgi:hypothetical protein